MSRLQSGETVQRGEQTLRVSSDDVEQVARMRRVLIAVALREQTMTYGELKAAAALPHPPHGLGRSLDLLAEDCYRRDEPRLDALVVSKQTGEVGSGHASDAQTLRSTTYTHWAERVR